MARPFKRYNQQLQRIKFKVTTNASISGSGRVYYETRKFTRSSDLYDPMTGGVRYRGRLQKKARCMDPETNDGLMGSVIAWACDDKPDNPDIEQVSGMHNGSVGLLEGNVICVISQPFQNIGQPT